MAWLEKVEDDAGNHLATLATAHDKYQLPDRSEMFIDTEPAWCRGCRRFVLVEKLTSPDELDANARAFAADRRKHPMKFLPQQMQADITQKLLDEGVAHVKQWRAALSVRVSPPRCLECGGTIHVRLPSNHQWLSDPDIPHPCVRVAEGMSHASMCESGRLYDTEGRRIPGRFADPNG